MMDQRKMDLESEDHRARRDMVEKSIARYIKSETERQVTSSATSSAVFVTDSTFIMSASVATPSYLCCGLSNGSVCLLNTSNLSKIYLFEVDRDPRAASRDGDRRGGPSAGQHQLVAISTHILAPSSPPPPGAASAASGQQLLLCLTLDNVVCVCPMDMSTVLERKKVSRSDMAKVKPFPPLKAASVAYAATQFNPTGTRVVAVLALSQTESTATGVNAVQYCVAVLSTTDAAPTLQSNFTCADDWHTLAPPTAPATDAPPIELCYCGWWSTDVLVCLWSNSCLQLLRGADMAVLGECRLLRHCACDAVTQATISRPGSVDTADGATTNIVALVLQHNVAATFYVTAKKAATAELSEPEMKRARGEVPLPLPLLLSVSPTLQTFCTEDIPIRELYLVRSFSWTVAVLLESGALVFLDVETMKLSVHRPVNRLRAPDADRYHAGASLTLPRHFFCVLHGKPFSAAIIEHNTAILLKAQ